MSGRFVFVPDLDDQFDYSRLDAGIRDHVRLLREHGIETYESCAGGAGHAFPEPTIRFHGDFTEGYRAVALLLQHGRPVYALRRHYQVYDCAIHGPEWEVVVGVTVPTPDECVPKDTTITPRKRGNE